LAQARQAIEDAQVRWQQESAAALSHVERQSKAELAARIAAAEAAVQDQSARALADAAARLKRTEAELVQTRAQAEALRRRGDEADIRQLRNEYANLRAKLGERDMELAQLRSDTELARERWTAEARVSLQKAEHVWKAEMAEAAEKKGQSQTSRRFVRDIALVGSLSALAVMFYLRLNAAGPDLPPNDSPVKAQPIRTVHATEPALAVVIHGANVRSGPSSTAAVVASLPRDAKVQPLDHHGNWSHVAFKSGAEHKLQQGWIYSSFLKDEPVAKASPTVRKS
jgi:hypothetical protein